MFHPCKSVVKNSLLHRMRFQRFQIHEFQHGDVAGFQHHGTRVTGFERLRPTPHADAPAVAGCQAGEIVFGARRDEVVTLQREKFQKLLRDLAADGVQPAIFRSGAAKAIAVKPGHGRLAATF